MYMSETRMSHKARGFRCQNLYYTLPSKLSRLLSKFASKPVSGRDDILTN